MLSKLLNVIGNSNDFHLHLPTLLIPSHPFPSLMASAQPITRCGVLNAVLQREGVFCDDKPIKLRHGGISTHYFDIGAVMGDAYLVSCVSDLLKEAVLRLSKGTEAQVAGVPHSGIPLAALASCFGGIPLLVERSGGKGARGGVDKSVPVILVEDTITTGTSTRLCVDSLRDQGYTVYGVVSVLNRRNATADTFGVAAYESLWDLHEVVTCFNKHKLAHRLQTLPMPLLAVSLDAKHPVTGLYDAELFEYKCRQLEGTGIHILKVHFDCFNSSELPRVVAATERLRKTGVLIFDDAKLMDIPDVINARLRGEIGQRADMCTVLATPATAAHCSWFPLLGVTKMTSWGPELPELPFVDSDLYFGVVTTVTPTDGSASEMPFWFRTGLKLGKGRSDGRGQTHTGLSGVAVGRVSVAIVGRDIYKAPDIAERSKEWLAALGHAKL